MAIPDPPKAGSPFCALWTGGWNPKTPKINNFFIPEITLRGGLPSRSLEADTKLEPFWPVTPEPEPAPQRQSERTFMTLADSKKIPQSKPGFGPETPSHSQPEGGVA